MKTCYLKVATLCSVALFLGACNKDNEIQPTPNESRFPDDPIEQLRSFQKQIEETRAHPGQRSQETITLTEALWDVENHFNMTYSDPEQYYSQTNTHEFTLMLPIDASQRVLVNDAVNLYDQMIEEARLSMASDPFEDKGLISLYVDQIDGLDEVIQVTFKAKTGERCTYSPPGNFLAGPFGVDDNWMAASTMGKCDDPDIPSGADKELQEKLFDNLIGTLPEAGPGQRNIFTDRRTFIFDGHNYNGIYLSEDTDDLCIPFFRMNELFRSEKTIISTTIPEQYHLGSYTPISIEICGVYSDYDNKYTHRNEVVYGKPCRVSIDEFGEVEDLLQP